MTRTPAELEKENAALRAQLSEALTRGNEALDLATETSVQLDQAVNTLTAVTGVVIAQKDAAPPAPAPPPPTPAPAPFVPAPASFNEWMGLPGAQKKAVMAAHGEDIEERLYNEKMNQIRIGAASRAGSESHRIVSFGALLPPTVEESRATARAAVAAYQAGAPKPFVRGTPAVTTATSLGEAIAATMNAGVGHGGARSAAKAAPAPAPAPAQKTRFLGRNR
jgi:hypothetical protein